MKLCAQCGEPATQRFEWIEGGGNQDFYGTRNQIFLCDTHAGFVVATATTRYEIMPLGTSKKVRDKAGVQQSWNF